MMLTELDREAMMRDLEAVGLDLWLETYSELQRGGAELPIWVLINSRDVIRPAFDRVMATTKPYRERADETDFSISIDEWRNDRLFHWNHIEPGEIRSGRLMFDLGHEAMEGSRLGSVYKAVRAADE